MSFKDDVLELINARYYPAQVIVDATERGTGQVNRVLNQLRREGKLVRVMTPEGYLYGNPEVMALKFALARPKKGQVKVRG